MTTQIVSDPRTAETTPPHPGEPTREAFLDPLALRGVHPAYPELIGVSATYWNPTTRADEEVEVVAVETSIVLGAVPNLVVQVGGAFVSVAPSLLCEARDGAAVPRFRLVRTALYNKGSQRAVVYDADGERYTVEAKGEEEDFRVEVAPLPKGTRIAHWVQPSGSRLPRLGDDAHPFPAFQTRVRDDALWNHLLMMFDIVVNASGSPRLRSMAADAFARAEAPASLEFWERFSQAVLAAVPQPGMNFFDVPISGRGAGLVRAIATKYGIPIPDSSP